jgi:hypothetical protein
MVPMPAQQQPIELDGTPSEAVVEFGPPPPPRSRWQAGGFLRDLSGDRRVVPLLAGLAAVAALASLFSEWQITTVNAEFVNGGTGERTVAAQVGDLGVLGTGYLLGLFLVVAAVVLTLFGPPGGRRYARLAGLSAGGTALGVLLALAADLSDRSEAIDRVYELALDADQMSVTHGRGIWCALAAMVLALASLYLAGRHLGAPATVDAPEMPEPATTWAWRRSSAGDQEQEPLDEPMDLTVAPVKPFTSFSDDRDQPRR